VVKTSLLFFYFIIIYFLMRLFFHEPPYQYFYYINLSQVNLFMFYMTFKLNLNYYHNLTVMID